MKLRIGNNIRWLVLSLSIILVGCEKSPLSELSKEEQTQVKADLDKLLSHSKEDMIKIEGGQFNMQWLEPNETIIHKYYPAPLSPVTLDGFYMSRFQITLKDYLLYRKIKGYPENPYPLKKSTPGTDETDDETFNRFSHNEWDEQTRVAKDYAIPALLPWEEANSYCQWLGEKTGLPYNLATNAQWEYAARNRGKDDVYFATDNGKYQLYINTLSKIDFGRFKIITGSKKNLLLPVDWYPASPLGLYAMGNNGKEWVSDWYDKAYYDGTSRINPQGPSKSKLTESEKAWGKDRMFKVVRGSGPSWYGYYNGNLMFAFRPTTLTSGKKFDALDLTFIYSTARCVINSNDMNSLEKK